MNADLGLKTDPQADLPLYRQIATQLAERIRDGTLPPGFRLPPTRKLAAALGTNRNTVVAAFELLTTNGTLLSVVGRGTFVADAPAPRPMAALEPGKFPWSSVISRTTESGSLQVADRLRRRVAQAPERDLINLQRMEPSPDLLPAEDLRRCVAHALKTEGAAALGYAPREGLPRLRTAIADDLARRGVPVAAEELLVTTGSQQALDLVARILIEPGDTMLVQNATYTGAIHVLAAAGARLVGVADDDEGPDMATLDRLGASGAKGLYLMPTGQNPTGRTISGPRREALVAWSRRFGIPLIEDDFSADLHLDDGPAPVALRALDSQVLHIGTFSKRLIPALRIGYLAFPKALKGHLTTLKHAMDLGSSLVLQHALAEFLQRGYLRTHLRHVLPEYRARRDAMERGLHKHLPSGMQWSRSQRGVVTWIGLPPDLDADEAFSRALDLGVLVSPDALFTVHGQQRGLRLTFCAETPRRIMRGTQRLGQALRACSRTRATGGAALAVV